MLESLATKTYGMLAALRDGDEGQALVEYALVLVLVALVCVGGLTLLGTDVSNLLNNVAGQV
jgi:pilus assembly protein Flp/PilA